jgi:hypothetical protein
VPKKSKPAKRPHGGSPQIGGSPQDGGRAQAPIYKQKPPKGVASALRAEIEPQARPYNADLPNAHIIAAAPFELREDGSIIPGTPHPDPLPAGEGIINPAWRKSEAVSIRQTAAKISPSPGGEGRGEGGFPSLGIPFRGSHDG